MPNAGSFAIGSCQASLFTPEANVSPTRFVARFLSQWGGRFDAEPTIIPLPDGVPREVPKVILESRNQQWRCEVASARVNLFWRRTRGDVERMNLREFCATALPMLIEYRAFVESPVRRLAAVVSRYAPHDDPARYLAGHFCRERWLEAPFNRPENFELHSHKQFQLADGLTTNSWVRNKTGRLVDTNQPVILVEQDLNTLAEDTQRDFTEEDLGRFFEAVTVEFDTILNLYFPADLD